MADQQHSEAPEAIEMPAPTPWPMLAALGITFGFAGLVTNGVVTLVGVPLALVGIVGWWREVLPVEKHERVPVVAPARRASTIVARPEAVEHLRIGEEAHRVRLPVEIHPYRSGVRGGIAGGVAMAIVAIAYGLLAEGSVWYPINLLAGSLLPSLDGADPTALRAFDGLALGLAVLIHGATSIFVGLVFAMTLPMLPRWPLVWGGLVAPLLWSAVLWLGFGIINPALAAHVDWPWFVVSQIAFGLTTGYVVSRGERVKTMQAWPLAQRAGIEAPGVSPAKGDE